MVPLKEGLFHDEQCETKGREQRREDLQFKEVSTVWLDRHLQYANLFFCEFSCRT